VAKLVRDDRFCRFLRGAKDKEEIAELLLEADTQLDTAGAAGS
jgi:mannitol/fructose-specific phosphotransferase system IIA component (Ntr-type)